ARHGRGERVDRARLADALRVLQWHHEAAHAVLGVALDRDDVARVDALDDADVQAAADGARPAAEEDRVAGLGRRLRAQDVGRGGSPVVDVAGEREPADRDTRALPGPGGEQRAPDLARAEPSAEASVVDVAELRARATED